ncbi:MAG: hypothetical protein CUN55_04710 [Phototrophicales bacterium]|nr:MAG: hypothetical protein CUN55_04710 [Phototrophicales bacterium]
MHQKGRLHLPKYVSERLGVSVALLTPVFLGMNPIFGKLAYREGADPFTVAALRTVLAVFILWVFYYLFARRYLFIYPAGLMNCIAIGAVNGIGSLMYYNGLNYLDASIAQLLNGMYLVFVVILTRVGGQQIGIRTIIRIFVALIGVFIITGGMEGQANWLGIGLMLGNALLFAGTIVMSQRALYDMPAQTVTFYVLATMGLVVSMARFAYDLPVFSTQSGNTNYEALLPIIGLAITTAMSRLLMFVSVKGLGSVQTTLLAILEIGASLLMAYIFLSENLSPVQWIGAGVLAFSLLMPTESLTPKHSSPMSYTPFLVRTRIMQKAFEQAFIVDEESKLSTQQINAMRNIYNSEKYTTLELIAAENILNENDTVD